MLLMIYGIKTTDFEFTEFATVDPVSDLPDWKLGTLQKGPGWSSSRACFDVWDKIPGSWIFHSI